MDTLPPYVEQQQTFYARTATSARRGYVATETLALVAAAAVPVCAAADWPRWSIALLGALAAIMTGLRQVFEYRQNWILRSVALETIKARIAAYEARPAEPATRRLVTEVAEVALAETDRWRRLGEQASVTAPKPDGT